MKYRNTSSLTYAKTFGETISKKKKTVSYTKNNWKMAKHVKERSALEENLRLASTKF